MKTVYSRRARRIVPTPPHDHNPHAYYWRASNDEPNVFGPPRAMLVTLGLAIVLWIVMGALLFWSVDLLAVA